MPPRPILPSDDLYRRLELPTDATAEAIELAWRALLRRHHPDIAGPAGLEVSKRINVAHDWLSDPGLRARYDRDRGVPGAATRKGADGGSWRDSHASAAHARVRHRPRPAEDQIARFLDRISGLTPDELDRLEAADPAPIAFGATIRRFIPDAGRAALESVEAEIARRLSRSAAARPGIHDTIDAYAAELVLGSFLDDLLSEPFRARARERLTRGWEAAVGQPRYGPNGKAITELLGRLRVLDTAGIAALGARGSRARLGEDPWPPGVSPEDDEALRVSSVLAARDAIDAIAFAATAGPAASAASAGPAASAASAGPAASAATGPSAASAAGAAAAGTRLDRTTITRAGRAAARITHLLVLRHAFAPATFDQLIAPWRPSLIPDDLPTPRVRRPSSG
jgi:curved DNA-binding protein CbpA